APEAISTRHYHCSRVPDILNSGLHTLGESVHQGLASVGGPSLARERTLLSRRVRKERADLRHNPRRRVAYLEQRSKHAVREPVDERRTGGEPVAGPKVCLRPVHLLLDVPRNAFRRRLGAVGPSSGIRLTAVSPFEALLDHGVFHLLRLLLGDGSSGHHVINHRQGALVNGNLRALEAGVGLLPERVEPAPRFL